MAVCPTTESLDPSSLQMPGSSPNEWKESVLSLIELFAQVIGLYTPFNFRHCRFVAIFFFSQIPLIVIVIFVSCAKAYQPHPGQAYTSTDPGGRDPSLRY
jgi:hypothetical protein